MSTISVLGVEAGIDHGTPRGYRQHRYRKVAVCEPCRDAYRVETARYRPPTRSQTGVIGRPRQRRQDETVSTVQVRAVPAPCAEPECGSPAAGSVPDGWTAAVVGGFLRAYCRPWCAVYAQALADVRSIDRTEAA